MRYLLLLPVVAAGVFCAQPTNNNADSITASDKDTLPPVETAKPNTTYKPAFAGQTRIQGVKTTTAYKVEKIAEGLGRPWGITPLKDGRFIITEKTGFMTIHDANGKQLKKITGFPEVDSRGQGGLLDVAPDPDFAKNKMLYWSFSEKQQDGTNLTAVAKGKLSADETKIENPTVFFRATPSLNSNLHFGSRVLFDKNGNLFVSAGERSILDGRKQAQLLSSGLGKIFHITKDGKPAPGNPFIGKQGIMPEIYSYGHRNPQGLAFHPTTGDLWEAEFGPMGGDEVNIIKAGKDYGWPTITYALEYSRQKVGEGIQQKAGMEQPIYYWDPTLAPSGMEFYAGSAIPEWKNNLFIGGLASMHIARLVIVNNKVVGEERLLTDKNERFRDIAYANNMLYTITDGGSLYRISKK